MLEIGPSDLSFRVLSRECSRRRDDIRDEARERIAGFLAIALVVAVPLYSISGSGVSLVEASEAAEPATSVAAFEPPLVNFDAVMSRLETNQLGRSDIRAVQTQLKLKGFDPGPIDGIAGQRTVAALNAFRESVDLPPSQILSREAVAGLQNR